MTDTNKCKLEKSHIWFEQIGSEWLRICWLCGLKQKRVWVTDRSEEM